MTSDERRLTPPNGSAMPQQQLTRSSQTTRALALAVVDPDVTALEGRGSPPPELAAWPRDIVSEQSLQSFPASDPPSWTGVSI